MKLYHFTAERFLKSIEKNGLTRGVMTPDYRKLAEDAKELAEPAKPSQSTGARF